MVALENPVGFLAEHYVYEINMLRQTYVLLAKESCKWRRNALMESFSIHARVLLDFYRCKPRNDKDDVVASHFTEPDPFNATQTINLSNEIRERINKQVPHLTAARENTDKINDSDRQALLAAIEADHQAFKAALGPKYSGCFCGELPRPVF